MISMNLENAYKSFRDDVRIPAVIFKTRESLDLIVQPFEICIVKNKLNPRDRHAWPEHLSASDYKKTPLRDCQPHIIDLENFKTPRHYSSKKYNYRMFTIFIRVRKATSISRFTYIYRIPQRNIARNLSRLQFPLVSQHTSVVLSSARFHTLESNTHTHT